MTLTRRRLGRTAALLGMVGAAASAAVLVPSVAQAATPIGADPGHLTLTPSSGALSLQPTWATDTPCGTNFNSSAKLEIVKDNGSVIAASGTVTPVTAPFSGTLQANMTTIKNVAGMVAGHTYEFFVACQTATLQSDPEQSTFVTISADGTSWSSSATPPAGGAVTTTTTLTADPTSASQGDTVTLSATVAASDTAGTDAAGKVEFFNGTTSLGSATVAAGKASLPVSTLPVGDDAITATFEPTDSTAFGTSTSAAVTVTVSSTGGGTTTPGNGQETIDVNVVQAASGSLTLTVDNTPVSMSTAKNIGTVLDSTGTLSPVTVTDSRVPTRPGWDISGSVSDFTSGSHTIDGNGLGWTPKLTTANTAGDVTAGGVVAPSNPGLKAAAPLASAAATHGAGTTVLGADLDLRAPVDTAPGSYSATLTVTLLSK
jgi:hypothetical protein